MITKHSRDGASEGWLLSSPSTTIISRRKLATFQSNTSSKNAMSSPSHFAKDQNRLSDGSETSTPGMTEGSSGSESDVSLDDDHLQAEQARDELWDSYFENRKTYQRFNTYNGPPSRSTTPRNDRSKTAPVRRHSPPSHLSRHPSSPPRNKFKRSPLASPLLRPEYTSPATYSPFPPTSSTTTTSTSPRHSPLPLHVPHKSWPLRIESRQTPIQTHSEPHIQTQTQTQPRPPMRPRAKTSPSPSDIQRIRTQAPASLRLCTTPRDALTPATGALSMHSTPSSPMFAPQEFMDGMGSYLDIDDDEDEEGDEKGGLVGLVGRLRIKRGACEEGSGEEGKGKNVRERVRKISREVFGLKW